MKTEPPPHVPVTINSERALDYERACFLVMTSEFSFRRARVVTERLDLLSRVPDRATLRCHRRGSSLETVLGETPEGVFLVETYPAGNTRFEVAAASADAADGLVVELVGAVPPRPDDWLDVDLWRHTDGGVKRWSRTLTVPAWADICRNYAARTGTELRRLMGLSGLDRNGGLIIFTGPPGTGKTSAIRALLRSWRGWSRAHLVPDPERFFGDSSYLIDVIAAGDADPEMVTLADGTKTPRWKLVVCEDADDFISRDNRRVAGSGVGRLLNLADGLLGQGLRTAVLLTSNTTVAELDPALTRPGRCLAQIEFDKFDQSQARAWLGDVGVHVPRDGVTLAELFERSGQLTKMVTTDRESPKIGAYL